MAIPRQELPPTLRAEFSMYDFDGSEIMITDEAAIGIDRALVLGVAATLLPNLTTDLKHTVETINLTPSPQPVTTPYFLKEGELRILVPPKSREFDDQVRTLLAFSNLAAACGAINLGNGRYEYPSLEQIATVHWLFNRSVLAGRINALPSISNSTNDRQPDWKRTNEFTTVKGYHQTLAAPFTSNGVDPSFLPRFTSSSNGTETTAIIWQVVDSQQPQTDLLSSSPSQLSEETIVQLMLQPPETLAGLTEVFRPRGLGLENPFASTVVTRFDYHQEGPPSVLQTAEGPITIAYQQPEKIPVEVEKQVEVEVTPDSGGNPCPDCEMPMIHNGGCEQCPACGLQMCGF